MMRRLLVLAMALAALCCCGCFGGGSPQPSSGHAATSGKATEMVSVKLYFPQEDGMKLGAVSAEVPRDDKYRAVVDRLVAGTTQPGLTGIFPQGVKVRGVNVANGTATVDFSAELRRNFQGGSTGEEMLVGSLVNTLTEFREVERVCLLVEGKRVSSIGGHLDASEPFARMTQVLP